MIEWILQNADKASVVSLLMLAFGLFVTAWYREWIILGKTHHRMLAEKNAEFERERLRCERTDQRNERLLAHLESLATTTEKIAEPMMRRTRRVDLPDDPTLCGGS